MFWEANQRYFDEDSTYVPPVDGGSTTDGKITFVSESEREKGSKKVFVRSKEISTLRVMLECQYINESIDDMEINITNDA